MSINSASDRFCRDPLPLLRMARKAGSVTSRYKRGCDEATLLKKTYKVLADLRAGLILAAYM